MGQLFSKVDADGSGIVEWGEFKECLKEPEMIMYFEAFDLDIAEAEELFKMLDVDGSGGVEFDEFVNGCFRLRGPAKAMDLAALGRQWELQSNQMEASLTKIFHLLSDGHASHHRHENGV